jgi:hypothetical protein
MLSHRTGIWLAKSMEMPVGLKHFDSEFCWCDPIIEVDEDERKVVIHKEVTWH